MRGLVALVMAAAVAWGGYWYAGSRAVLAGARAALAELRDQRRGDAAGVTLAGFPSRFDLTIAAPSLTSADGSLGWAAPFVQIFALSYQPHHLIAVWPHQQSLTIAGQRLTLLSSDMRASAVAGASLALPLDHAQMVASGITLGSTRAATGGRSAGDWDLSLREIRLALRRADTGRAESTVASTASAVPAGAPPLADDGRDHQIGLALDDLAPGPGLRRLIDPGGRLPALIRAVSLTAILSFDRPIDRHAAATGARITAIRDIKGDLRWGEIAVSLGGALGIGQDGLPEGQITLVARQWRPLLAALTEAGAIRPEVAPTVTRMAEALARGAGDSGDLTLPLDLGSGWISLGPFPLAPIPRWQ